MLPPQLFEGRQVSRQGAKYPPLFWNSFELLPGASGCEGFRDTSHTRLRTRDKYTSSALIGGNGGASPSLASHYAWGTNGVYKWMQDGCNVYMDSYVASNGSCFMVPWILFKIHLLEVGLTQNRETMGLQTLTTVDLFYFIILWGHAWIRIHWNSIWLRARNIWLHTTLEDPWPHYMILRVCWDDLWTLFFWALTISSSRLLARVRIGP